MNALVRPPLDGDILGPAEVITVTAAVHPLKPQAEILILPAGLSLAEIVQEVSERCRVSRLTRGADVSIAGHPVDQTLWSKVRVKPGAHVVVRARAGKALGNVLKSLLMIALSVAAAWIVGPAGLGIAAAIGGTAGQIAASLVAGAIMTAGGLALNALFPPSQTKSQDESPSYSISAGRNGASKWGAIPVVLGKVRALPKYASTPYTEFDGDDQYLRMLFVWGYGPIKIDDIRIGETPIGEFGDVEIQTREGYAGDAPQTLYPAEVVQEDFSVDPEYNVAVVRTSAEDATEIVLDFVAAAGIGQLSSKNGKFSAKTVEFRVETSPAGANAWLLRETFELSGQSNKAVRRSRRYGVAKGKYDVRVTRLTANSDDTNVFDDVTWTALKSFRTAPSIDFRKPLAITALRIRATKQLNGAINNLSALVTTVASSWNGAAWVAGQQTRSPADLYRLVLQGPANARPQPDSRVDLATLEAWADRCRAAGYTFDMYRDFTASVRDTLRDIAAAGRAVPTFKDGMWSVAWEDDSAPVVQHFTPRNSRDFRWSQTYRVFPHALRARFVNADKDYVEDEILVYDEGYSKENATLTEQVEFPGVTSTELVYKHGLYRIADAKERPAVYTLTVDFEHLVSQRADRVAVAHDVIVQGFASGRVQAVNGQQLTLDEPAVMEAGKLYGIRIRRGDGTSIVRQVTTVPGEQRIITITGGVPEVGDLYTFGIRDHETGIYRILRIRPGSDLSAEIDLVDDGENVQAGDASTDIPGGVAPAPTNQMVLYRPTNLRAESFIESRSNGAVHVVRIYWQGVTGASYASFEVVGTSSQGTVREVVDGSTLAADFENLQSAAWTFTVRGLFADGRYTLPSVGLVVPIDVPYDDLGVSQANLLADVRSWQAEIATDVRKAWDTLEAIGVRAAAAALGAFSDVQKVRQELAATASDSKALWQQDILVAAGPNSVIAQRIETISASLSNYATLTITNALAVQITTVDGKTTSNADAILAIQNKVNNPSTGLDAVNASILSMNSTISTHTGQISANNSALLALQTSYNDISADATLSFKTGYAPGPGYTSRIALQASVSGGTLRVAGMYVDVNAAQARLVFSADQTAFLAGGNLVALFEPGQAYFNKLLVRELDASIVNVSGRFDAALILQNGTTVTDLIAAEATSSTGGAFSGSTLTVGPASTGTAQAASISGVRSTGSVMILFTATTTADGTDGWQYNLYRNSTLLRSYSLTGAAAQKDSSLMAYRDVPGTGNFTYVVELTKLGTQNAYSSNRSLMLWNQKT